MRTFILLRAYVVCGSPPQQQLVLPAAPNLSVRRAAYVLFGSVN